MDSSFTGSREATAYIEVSGDAKLARRFSTFLEYALEDAGIARIDSQSDADFTIEAKLEPEIETVDIGTGIVRLQLTHGGEVRKSETCPNENSNPDAELFDNTAKNVASEIHEKFPGAHTVTLDRSSDMAASKVFIDQLPRALTASGLHLESSGAADVILRVDLVNQRVPVEERVAKVDVDLFGKDGKSLTGSRGTTIVSVKLAAPPPQACPGQFEDVTWLAAGSLYNNAQVLAKDLRRRALDRKRPDGKPASK